MSDVAWISKSIIRDPALSPAAKLAYLGLMCCENTDETPTVESLAVDLGMTKRETSRGLGQAVRVGLLTVVDTDSGPTYSINGKYSPMPPLPFPGRSLKR